MYFISQDRHDEFDYKKPLEGQTMKPLEQHWRKHTLAHINPDSGKVSKILSTFKVFSMIILFINFVFR